MIFNTKNKIDAEKAKNRLNWAIENNKRIEIIVKRFKRTNNQNRYLHLLLNYFALETGETLEYVKQNIFKRMVCKSIFIYDYKNPKTKEISNRCKSSADLNTKEMTDAIDTFRNFSSKEAGIYLPEANEHEFLDSVENEIENNKQYLY